MMKGGAVLPKKKVEKLEVFQARKIICPDCKSRFDIPKDYTCVACGQTYTKQESNFFKINASPMWRSNNNFHPVCQNCMRDIFNEIAINAQSDEYAMIACCAILDVAFFKDLFEAVKQNNGGDFKIGLYLRQLTNRQYANKTFLWTIVGDELEKSAEEIRDNRESKWNKADRQNRTAVIASVGYDPFVDCGLNDDDRRYCFNVLAGYCDIDGIQEDSHKLQSAIRIAFLQLQCNKLEAELNMSLSKGEDEKKINKIVSSKKILLESITSIAEKNNLVSNAERTSGAETLSEKMNRLARDGYDAIKTNLFDIKTCQAMEQIARLSAKSLIKEIELDEADYSEIVKEQRELIAKFESKAMQLEEENRLLKLQLQETGKKRIGA